jgi:predicted adenylyl cyclase CyaB
MRNLEAKFRLGDLGAARAQAEAIGFTFRGILVQRDTFFSVPHGKLKLREQPDGAWLIHYRREQAEGLKLSNYEIAAVANPEAIRAMLSAATGVIAEVRKQRTLLMRGKIRLHLDRVDGLGEFGEIEAVLSEGDEAESYRAAVAEILGALEVRDGDLIGVSYFELMRSTAGTSASARR